MNKSHPFIGTVLGTALLGFLLGISSGLLTNLLQDQFTDSATKAKVQLWVGFGALGLAGLVGLVLTPQFRRLLEAHGFLRIFEGAVTQRIEPAPAKALICLVSAGKGSATTEDAIFYHLSVLKKVWLIHTTESEGDAVRIKNGNSAPGRDIELVLLTDASDVSMVYRQVEELRLRAINKMGLDDAEIVCDSTGLTKMASGGMVLACAPPGRRLQYMQAAARDENMRGVSTAGARSRPIEITMSYHVSE